MDGSKLKLTEEERKRMQNLVNYANNLGEPEIAHLAKLALDMDAKGEYSEFAKLFSTKEV